VISEAESDVERNADAVLYEWFLTRTLEIFLGQSQHHSRRLGFGRGRKPQYSSLPPTVRWRGGRGRPSRLGEGGRENRGGEE